jgi:hypothetical protein
VPSRRQPREKTDNASDQKGQSDHQVATCLLRACREHVVSVPKEATNRLRFDPHAVRVWIREKRGSLA